MRPAPRWPTYALLCLPADHHLRDHVEEEVDDTGVEEDRGEEPPRLWV